MGVAGLRGDGQASHLQGLRAHPGSVFSSALVTEILIWVSFVGFSLILAHSKMRDSAGETRPGQGDWNPPIRTRTFDGSELRRTSLRE